MTRRHTADTITDDALDALYDRADRAEAELRARTEADSADATAGSYAHRAEHAEAALARVRKLIADDPSGIFSDDEIRAALGDQP